MPAPLITLTTDLGLSNYYAAALKGQLYDLIPDARLLDVSHMIKSFDAMSAALELERALPFMPAKAVHLVAVGNQDENTTDFLVARRDETFYIGYDNGMFTRIFENKSVETWVRPIEITQTANSFDALKAFALAAFLSVEGRLTEFFVSSHGNYKKAMGRDIIPIGNRIQISINTVDAFENAITNLHFADFEKLVNGRPYQLNINRDITLFRISPSYSSVAQGSPGVLFNASGYMEVFLRGGRGASLMGLNVDKSIYLIVS